MIMTRQHKVLQLLRSKEKVCCYDFANIWVYGYADVIMRLRRKWYQITTTNIYKRKDWWIKRYWEYRLVSEDIAKAIQRIESQKDISIEPTNKSRLDKLLWVFR